MKFRLFDDSTKWRFGQMTFGNSFLAKQRFGKIAISTKRRFDEMTLRENDVAQKKFQ